MDAGQVFYVEFSFRKAKDESMKKNAPLELEPDSLADNREYCKIFWSTTRAEYPVGKFAAGGGI